MSEQQMIFQWATDIPKNGMKQRGDLIAHGYREISRSERYPESVLIKLDYTISDEETTAVVQECQAIFSRIESMPLGKRISCLNAIRLALHSVSPFAKEPVDCVQWVHADQLSANDYNPNDVAPPEMQLLEHSITEDGYTQPIVTWRNDGIYEVVDGFHRNRVGKESKIVRERVLGYLPITTINTDRQDRGDRIAATIRHNRARGKHRVEGMSEIVLELKRRNWSDEKIGKELGMDPDEVLRLCQITGMAELFANQEFSQSWDIDTADETTVIGEILSDEAGA